MDNACYAICFVLKKGGDKEREKEKKQRYC